LHCHSESLLRGICFSLFRYAPNSRSLAKTARDDSEGVGWGDIEEAPFNE
jgi:hypothetical protein